MGGRQTVRLGFVNPGSGLSPSTIIRCRRREHLTGNGHSGVGPDWECPRSRITAAFHQPSPCDCECNRGVSRLRLEGLGGALNVKDNGWVEGG